MYLAELKTVVGTSATICLIIQFLTGIQVCAQFYMKKTTGDTSGLTFLAGVVMTYIWYSYGVLIQDLSIQLVNGEVVYSFCYLAYSPAKCDMSRRMVVTLIFMLTVQTYIILEEDIPTAQLRVGLLCACLTVVYCNAPLASL